MSLAPRALGLFAACGLVAAAAPIHPKALTSPMVFEANQGQTSPRAAFLARSSGSLVYLTSQGAVIKTAQRAVAMTFVGGAASAPQGTDRLPARAHYFLAHRSLTVPTFQRVEARQVYPGVDVSYYGRQGSLEYDLDLAPHASVAAIRLQLAGATPKILADGSLALGSGIEFRAPRAYQMVAGRRQAVAVRYALAADHTLGFTVGSYDVGQPLVIDPVLAFASLLGGTGFNSATAVAVDSTGAGYLTGTTLSTDFPTVGPIQAALKANHDVFVTKFSPDGTKLVYSTYIGGGNDDEAMGIAVDSTGAAYITGFTNSTDFPTTTGSFQATAPTGGNSHAFVAKLTADGSALVYSTFLGGTVGADQGNGIAVDGAGDAFVVGTTTSSDFPVSVGAPQAKIGSTTASDAFVAAVNPAGSGLLYSTFVGGSNSDRGQAIAVDQTGNAYAVGATASTDFPTTPGAFQSALGGKFDAFVVKVDHSGRAFDYSTYLGGKLTDEANAVAVDAAGEAFIAGDTGSIDIFPGNSGFITGSSNGNNSDAFAAKISASGAALIYGTYLSGGPTDAATGIAVDGAGNAFVGGNASGSFVTTSNAVQPQLAGPQDAFLVKLNAVGAANLFSTFFGGTQLDAATGVALDAAGDLYLAGNTSSSDFPVTKGAFQTTANSQNDAFIAKFVSAPQGVFSPTAVGFPAQAPTVASAAQTATFTNGGEKPLIISKIATTGPYTETDTCSANSSTLLPGASCSISIIFKPTGSGAQNGSLVITDNTPAGTDTLPLSGTGGDFSVTASPTTQTISAGSSASFGLNVTPATGYTQVVTLSCTGIGATQNATCTPSPTTLTMNGSTTATATFTVTTTVRPALVPGLPEIPMGPWSWLALLGLSLAGAGLFFSLRTRRFGRPRKLAWLGTAALLGWALAAAGCGGTTQSSGTPAGNYTLTLTGTAGSTTHSQTVTLTVN